MKKVAVYGSLRKGLGNHILLRESEFLGEEVIRLSGKMVSLGGFPGLIMNSEESGSPIVIEIYSVNEETFRHLDGLEGCYTGEVHNNANFYNRSLIETSYGSAWIYHLATPRDYSDDNVVESGDWVKFLNNQRKHVLS